MTPLCRSFLSVYPLNCTGSGVIKFSKISANRGTDGTNRRTRSPYPVGLFRSVPFGVGWFSYA